MHIAHRHVGWSRPTGVQEHHVGKRRSRSLNAPRTGRLKPLLISLAALVASTVSLASPAHADLATVGPVDPNTGFPQWLQDTSPLRLEPCLINASLTAAGPCFVGSALPKSWL